MVAVLGIDGAGYFLFIDPHVYAMAAVGEQFRNCGSPGTGSDDSDSVLSHHFLRYGMVLQTRV
jgi:hypothetical protein